MNKKEALSIVYDCAKSYDKNLKNYNIMFVIQSKKLSKINNDVSFIETIYYPHNFLHLTGINYNAKNTKDKSKYQVAMDFYHSLLNGKISYKDIDYKNTLTTKLKLEVLHNLINIDRSVKFVGDYNNTMKDKLYTEIVVGNVSYCFCFIKDSKTKYFYLPNSIIKENIKDITDYTYNIIAIMKKEKRNKFYSLVTYLKNGSNLSCLLKNEALANLIDFRNIRYANQEDNKNTNKLEVFRKEIIKITNEHDN